MVRNLSKHRFNYSFFTRLIFLTLILLFIFTPDVSATTQASFEWEPNYEPDIGGYRIFCREQSKPYDYAIPIWEGTETYSTIYNLDESKPYCFVVRAFDTDGFESEDSTEVCLDPLVMPNQPPAADAGPDQIVDEGQVVMLNGSNSTDPDDGIASYHWVQIGGPGVNLSDPDAEQLTFAAPDISFGGTALTFELTVADHNGNQGKDACVVNVTWQNEPPRAIAGEDQTVDEGVMVTLDGSLSLDIDDGISTYVWTQIGFPTVALSNPATSNPTFITPDVGPEGVSLTFQLTVIDAGNLQHTDACIVNITWQNEAPTAVIAPDYMETAEGALVILDGSASTDSDDGIDTYLWTQVEGDPISFSNPTSAVTSFTAPTTDAFDKNIELRLTVTDNSGLKDTADSSIYVIQNEPPTLSSVAITGSSQVNESSEALYTLTAYYSDGNSSEVTGFANWSENSPYASINNNGYLTVISVVFDQSFTITASYEGQSDTHSVIIENIPSNNSPAVDFSYTKSRKKAQFTDRSSDGDGTIVAWFWDFGDGTYNITKNPMHRYAKFGNYLVTLTVTDDGGLSNSLSKTVSIKK